MNHNQIKNAVLRTLKYQAASAKGEKINGRRIGPGHVPNVLGAVGGGKTELIQEIAGDLEMFYNGINFGENNDSTDAIGVPSPEEDEDGNWMTAWYPNEQMYRAMKQPCLLHLDDVDKAPPPAQNAILSLLQSRMSRGQKLHPGTLVCLSGNRIDDDMYSTELSESFRDRTKIFFLDITVKGFTQWGVSSKLIHPMLLGHLQFKPDLLHKVFPEEMRLCTPRTFRRASDEMFNEDRKLWKEILTTNLGSAYANDFEAWYTIYQTVDIQAICTNGVGSNTPSDPTELRRYHYAAVFALAHHLNDSSTVISSSKQPGLPIFINSLKEEMRVAFLIQLTPSGRASLGQEFPQAAGKLMELLVD